MNVIRHAMSQGILDAAILLAFDKLPPLSSVIAKGGALNASGITVVESTNFNMKEAVRMFETHNLLGTLEDMQKIADTLKSRIKMA